MIFVRYLSRLMKWIRLFYTIYTTCMSIVSLFLFCCFDIVSLGTDTFVK